VHNKLVTVGFHGTNKKFASDIIKELNFSLNEGDKFLGQGFYLWRDSFERAKKWAKRTINEQEISIIYVRICSEKDRVLNFTSFNWNNEKELVSIYLESFRELYFGQYLDLLIKEGMIDIDLVMIADLKNELNIIKVDDGLNSTNFACVDLQICLKNGNPIESIGEIK
jgi:hypothetical protein